MVLMKVLVIGAAGMIGRKLTARLARDGRVAGQAIDQAHLVDIVAPEPLANAPFPVSLAAFDIAAPYVAPKLIAPRPDRRFSCSPRSSRARPRRISTRATPSISTAPALMFEAIRREQALSGGAYRPRVVFTSSIAVFGAPFPERSATNSSPRR